MPARKQQITRRIDALKSRIVTHTAPIRALCGHRTYKTHRATGKCLECFLMDAKQKERNRD